MAGQRAHTSASEQSPAGLERRVGELEQEVDQLHRAARTRSVRRRSTRTIGGWPLYDIALGPDLDRNEGRGHAKGIFAIGDFATGVVAIGGYAQGIVAIGGMAIGVIGIGGLCLGLLAGVGGVVAGGAVLGGVAFGIKAIGGVPFELL